MPPDRPKPVAAAPVTQLPEGKPRSLALVLLVAAIGGAVGLVWGFETRACDGVVAGGVAAIMRASFLAFTHLPELGFQLMVFAVHLGIAVLLARRPPFRGREELLTMVMPVGGFAAGLAAAYAPWFTGTCALHPWA